MLTSVRAAVRPRGLREDEVYPAANDDTRRGMRALASVCCDSRYKLLGRYLDATDTLAHGRKVGLMLSRSGPGAFIVPALF